MKKNILILFIVFSISILTVSAYNNPLPIKVTGKIMCNKQPIANISVTDGISVVTTDKNGKYVLLTSTERTFIYYSLPSGYNTPIEGGIPVFYSLIDKTKKKQKINFEITKASQSQSKHAFIAVGDPQVSNIEDCELLKLVIDDVKVTVDELSINKPVHAISLGDIVHDRIALFDTYKKIIAKTKLPFYQVIGNHDIDYNKRSEELSSNSYVGKFGPTYYSYNKGNIHYVVLDNVFYYGYSRSYIGYIDEKQLTWLEKDLSTIKEGSTIILSFHIPAKNVKAKKNGNQKTSLSASLMNKKALYKIIEPYNTHILSGHSHVQWNTIIAPNIFEHTHSAACAAWWQGVIGTDGTPKGYTVYEIDGDTISWYFKAVGMDKKEQFNLYEIGADSLYPNSIIANVYNYDPSWKVEWFENGVLKGEMERYWGKDPLAKQNYQSKKGKKYSWINAKDTHHIFKAKIKDVSVKITVRVTDRFGNIYIKDL